jgi:hypothetical protein
VVNQGERNNRLELWRRQENLTYGQLSARIGAKSKNTARRYCLAPADPDHRLPSPPVMVNIYVESRGWVQPNHFYALPVLPEAAGNVAA